MLACWYYNFHLAQLLTSGRQAVATYIIVNTALPYCRLHYIQGYIKVTVRALCSINRNTMNDLC